MLKVWYTMQQLVTATDCLDVYNVGFVIVCSWLLIVGY